MAKNSLSIPTPASSCRSLRQFFFSMFRHILILSKLDQAARLDPSQLVSCKPEKGSAGC